MVSKYRKFSCVNCQDDNGDTLVFAIQVLPLMPEYPRCPGCGQHDTVVELDSFDEDRPIPYKLAQKEAE